MGLQQIEADLWETFEKESKEIYNYDVSQLKLTPETNEVLDKFFKKFLDPKEEFPSGSRHKVIEKNFAIYIVQNKIPLEQIKEAYKCKRFSINSLLSQIKGVTSGTYKNPAVNVGEIVNWCKQNNREDLADMIKASYKAEIILPPSEIKIMSDTELESYEKKEVSWRIGEIVKSGGILIVGAKRAGLKSWFNLIGGYCVAQGLDFLGKFPCNKGNVLYLDRENQFDELRNRARMVRKGLGINNEGNFYFISESYIKIDNAKNIEQLEQIIKEKDIKLLVCDVYRRLIGFDENDAGEVSKLFIDLLKPLTERTGVTIILIHHEKKGESSGDDMDMLRGSSDLANYVDGIIQLERKGNTLIVKQTKNRSGKELEPFQLKVVTDERTYFKLEYVGAIEGKGEKIAQIITDWILTKKLKQFTYTECWTYVKAKGGKEGMFKIALNELVSNGVVSKGEGWREPYIVNVGLEGYYGK